MRGATDAQVVVNESTDALPIGRVTFEQMRGYWPPQTEDATGVRDHLDEVRKYVLSPILRDPAWERSTVLRGPLLEEVRKLKRNRGRASSSRAACR